MFGFQYWMYNDAWTILIAGNKSDSITNLFQSHPGCFPRYNSYCIVFLWSAFHPYDGPYVVVVWKQGSLYMHKCVMKNWKVILVTYKNYTVHVYSGIGISIVLHWFNIALVSNNLMKWAWSAFRSHTRLKPHMLTL